MHIAQSNSTRYICTIILINAGGHNQNAQINMATQEQKTFIFHVEYSEYQVVNGGIDMSKPIKTVKLQEGRVSSLDDYQKQGRDILNSSKGLHSDLLSEVDGVYKQMSVRGTFYIGNEHYYTWKQTLPTLV